MKPFTFEKRVFFFYRWSFLWKACSLLSLKDRYLLFFIFEAKCENQKQFANILLKEYVLGRQSVAFSLDH